MKETDNTTDNQKSNGNMQSRSNNIRTSVHCRKNRSNDLARAIESWSIQKTARSFRVAVWEIGVDAVFGNTVFFPISFASDGRVIPVCSAAGSGRKIYLCNLDLPAVYEQGCLAYGEMELMDFIKAVLADDDAIGVTIRLEEISFFVDRGYLEDLLKKIDGLNSKNTNG